jgi:DNA-binding response OmpR family regulator
MTDKKIMLCDDDTGIIEMLELVLDITGAQVLSETNSLLLYDRLVREKPDLLILDLWMPVLSGDQIVKRIRMSESLATMPVLVISASTDGREIAMKAGADDYLAKPFDIDHLLARVGELAAVPGGK